MKANNVTIPVIRCVAYTRKSTEDGLEQEYNSLDAQREACEAYVESQRNEGWVLLPELYSDGGFSGSNTQRPALQQLINDIKAGKVDAVVCYKIDRLSRSLLDFAKLIEFFDEHNVSFLSVTQCFQTNTAMGRLTMHILLSFAAFERDIIAERVRDKIAGAKRKGKFTGGMPILGYDIDPKTHKLVVSPDEAKLIQHIFKKYAETGSGQTVAKELNTKGIKTKSWINKRGIIRSGKPWDRPAIYRIISNQTYLGLTVHKDLTFPGEHQAIISQSLWDKAHSMLSHEGRTDRRDKSQVQAMLKGIIRCGHCDNSMFSTYTKRKGKIYRYYCCLKASKSGYDCCPVRSVAAGEIEEAVINQLRAIFRDPELIREEQANTQMSGDVAVTGDETTHALRNLDGIWDDLFPPEKHRIVRTLIEQVTVYENGLDLRINIDGLQSIVLEMKKCQE